MIRVLIFLLAVFALGLGFAWLAERPGDMVITFGGYQYQVTLMTAAVIVAAIVAAVMILWWLLKAIWNSPHRVARYFRVRRRDRGYQALSTGMIAAGAGDAALARRMNREAARLISADSEPLLHLLEAQSMLLAGDHDAARKKFQSMTEDPETRLLGLRGLYLEAERLGERAAARHYAERAAAQAPQLGWAAESTIEQRVAEGDWDGALKLADLRKPARKSDAPEAAHRRAVLLTAKAMAVQDTDPLAARNAALEANRLAPELAPAALAAARALFKAGDLKKGARVLEASWRVEPHPEIGALYVHARPGDSVGDRLERARRLRSLRTNNAEAELAFARAALDAGELAEAREAAEASLRIAPRAGAWLALADIEERASGDEGRIRQILARALRAPRDPAWIADGVISDHWAPVSPVTGRLDAFEWRAPSETPSALIEHDVERELAALPSPAPPVDQPAAAAEAHETFIAESAAEPARPADDLELSAASPAVANAPPLAPIEELLPAPSEATAPPPLPALSRPPEHPAHSARLAVRAAETPPIPDDPGPDAEDEARSERQRFRLF